MNAVERLDRRFYPTFGDNWDAALFRSSVQRHIGGSTRILDFGAGRGLLPTMNFREPGRFVAAVDVDDSVFKNPFVDEAKMLEAEGRTIPYGDATFDVVIAHNVLEHLPEPATTFREIHRVLKPGGFFISKTPNRNHYVPTIARLTPHWFHIWVNQLRGREAHDTFPTVYRCNTRGTLAALARETGFTVTAIECVEGRPEYLRLNAAFYLVGLLYERAVNALPPLAGLRGVLITTLRKPTAG